MHRQLSCRMIINSHLVNLQVFNWLNHNSWSIVISHWTSSHVLYWSHKWFCYVVYNSRKFNVFINCTFWFIIVVITLGKCADRTPSGVRERHASIGLMKCKPFKCKHQFLSWTSVALNMCELNTTMHNLMNSKNFRRWCYLYTCTSVALNLCELNTTMQIHSVCTILWWFLCATTWIGSRTRGEIAIALKISIFAIERILIRPTPTLYSHLYKQQNNTYLK
jgi:hypothetical protein